MPTCWPGCCASASPPAWTACPSWPGKLRFLSIVNKLGDVAGGAHGIALGWKARLSVGAAFGTAGMTLVGQNLGAGKPGDAARGWVAFAMGGSVMSGMGIVFFSSRRRCSPLHPSKPGADHCAGVPVLRLVAFAMPAGLHDHLHLCLRSAGDTRARAFTWVGFLGVRIRWPIGSHIRSRISVDGCSRREICT